MVGVPTSRGCTACRKQKKKCISDDQIPPCERCKRLGIDCLELGQQRLKFHSENDKLAIRARKKDKNQSATTLYAVEESNSGGQIIVASSVVRQTYRLLIQAPPSSALTRLRAGCARAVDGEVDISVHLPWNYGPYLEQVPRHLGRSKAFDNTAEALIACYSCLRRQIRPAKDHFALSKYSTALNSLADALNDREQATSTETLASVSMLMVFESIAGFGPKSVLAHAGGAVKIFQERGIVRPRNEFEAMLQLSLRGSMVMQALFLPSLGFSKEEWSGLTESQIGADSAEEKAFRCFGEYVRLMHDANVLFEQREYLTEGCLVMLLIETSALSERLRPQLESLRQTFSYLTKSLADIGPTALVNSRSMGNKSIWGLNTYHAHIGRSYGLAMGNQVLINSLIEALERRLVRCNGSSCQSSLSRIQMLRAENKDLVQEVFQLAIEADHHRPLGTVYMPGVLRLASIGIIPGCVEKGRVTTTATDDQDSLNSEAGVDATINVAGSPDNVNAGGDEDMLDKLSLLLTRYCSDFEEPPSAEDNKGSFEWLRKKFTFQEMDLGRDRSFFS